MYLLDFGVVRRIEEGGEVKARGELGLRGAYKETMPLAAMLLCRWAGLWRVCGIL